MPRNARTGVARERRVRSRAPGVRREEVRDVRGAILGATDRLLAERPLDEITVLDVIQAAGVSRASFYIYFESKNAAVATLAEEVTARIYDDLWEPFITGEEPPSEELLRQHWLETLTLWRQHQAVLVAAAQAWRADPDAFDQWGAVWRRYLEDTRAYIRRARAAGDAPSDLDADTLAAALIWLNENALYMAFTQSLPELADDERLARTMAGIWMRAIYGTMPFE
jgi:AcrR family transcriptional regulator